MKKIILWSIVSAVIAGIAVDAFLLLRKPQVITLSDGTKLTLLNVEYGKHHVAPKIKTAGGRAHAGAARIDTTNDTLVVWILQEHKANLQPNYQLLAYDRAETACVGNWRKTSWPVNQSEEIAGAQLDAYPRWNRKIMLRVMLWGNNGERVAKEKFVVSNPARGSSAKWTPEPLPDTRSDGDLDVTLTKFIYGVPGFNNGNRPSKDPMNRAVLVGFHTEQKGVVMTNWQPIRIETSDAAGNHVQNNSWSTGRDDSGDSTMTYQWGLWPDESPWKLRVEMSQTSGFKDDELWTVQNVPVNPGSWQDLFNYVGRNSGTKAVFAETTLNGFHLKLFPAIQFTDQNRGNGEKPGGFRIQADQPLDGMQMTLVKATDEQERDVQSWSGNGWGGDNRQFQLQNLRNAKFLNITIALHKSRFVEFTAKPQKASDASVP